MTDRVDRLLEGAEMGVKSKVNPLGDRVERLLSGEGLVAVDSPLIGEEGTARLLQTGQEATGAIDTRTSKPITKPVSMPERAADFTTLMKTGFVDDMQTKINIFAKDRGISPEKYGVVDGQIVYLADDDTLYYETRQTPTGKIKRGVAESISHIPEMALSTALVPGGPLAVALGGAGGAGIRKSIGALAFDEPQTSIQSIKDMAIAGGAALVGEKIGGKTLKAIDVSRGKKGAALLKMAGKGKDRINLAATKEMEKLGEKYGIKLFSPQTTKSPQLIARFNLLGDTPVTADKIGLKRAEQYAQVDKAIGKWFDSFGPPTTTPESAGMKAVDAAKKGIKSATLIRQNKARPLYKKAFEGDKQVDIKPVVDFINSELNTAKGNVRSGLIKAKRLLEVPDLPKKQIILDAQGKEIGAKNIYDTSLKGLNDAKIALDDEVSKAMRAGAGNVRHNYMEVKKRLITEMDKVSPEYAKARKIYSSNSDVVTQLTSKKGKIGKLAKLEGDDIEKAAKIMFSPTASSPEIIKKAKPIIVKHGGEKAWNALIRVHMKQAFRDAVKTGTTNIGGQLRKRLFGDISQRAIMKSAMSKTQYKNFDDFMKVLERTSLITGKESTTATRIISQQDLQDEALGLRGKAMRAIAYPLYTWKRILVDFRAKLKTEKYQNKLVDLMTSEKASIQLQKMLQLDPKSQLFIKRVSVFLSSVGGAEISGAQKRSKVKDFLPSEAINPEEYLRSKLRK